jgi:hypothetical protein
MTGRSDTERFLDAFLAPEATDQLADRVLEAALADVARTPQRRALRVPWRLTNMPVFGRAGAAALAFVLLVGAGGVIYLNSRGFVGGTGPTATGTITFVSPQYGYSVDVPRDWTITAATQPYPGGDGIEPPDPPFADIFRAGDATEVRVKAQAVASGTTSAEWLSYWEGRRAVGGQCFGSATPWADATVAGVPARYFLWRCNGTTDKAYDEYTFLAGNLGFVISGTPSSVDIIVHAFRAP